MRGETKTLYVKVYPRNANNQTVTLKSSNPAVATVSNNGFVTAIKKGETVITVTTNDCNKQDSCVVFVIDLPKLETTNASNITNFSATIYGNISYTGDPAYTKRGVCYSNLREDPTIEDNIVEITDAGTGNFSVEITDLIPSTTYFVRAYAINIDGIAYGNEIDFRTFGPPILTTNPAINVFAIAATLGGTITNAGTPTYIEHGVCYSTLQTPTIADYKTIITGSGTGNFSAEITGLNIGTTYYVRAYAINVDGLAYGNEISFTTHSASIETVFVPGGTYNMGDYMNTGYSDEKPFQKVTLNSFNISKYQITEGEWKAIMCSNPSINPKGDNYPVEWVNWFDVQEFIAKLNELTGKNYRLPTEAEWEFVAKGGVQPFEYQYSGGNNIKLFAWYIENSQNVKHIVGTKEPNHIGVYDMGGNVYEWCSDWYGAYSGEAQTNPEGPSSGTFRVLRGGGYYSHAPSCRNTSRSGKNPNEKNSDIGFRLVLP